MARIAGVNIPDNKHTVISLQYVFGIGQTRAQAICKATGIAESAKVSSLSEEQLEMLRTEVGKFDIAAVCQFVDSVPRQTRGLVRAHVSRFVSKEF